LAVFAKVFYEKLGFYGKSAHIAGFELTLFEEGLYEKFKSRFEEVASRNWEKARETLALYKNPCAQVLSDIKGVPLDDAKEYIDSLKEDFSLSIETFAEQVNGYISSKPKGFRLIFCVDEIGQFIGDNTKLMLNLQTIVESLATKCSGRAWVIVTSQEDIDKLIERNSGQSNDFSKIQGRFKVKLNLTSKDADEVIEQRLLAKNDDACTLLNTTYNKYSNTLRSIIHFEGREYKQYKDPSNFIETYPFVPYQFTMFTESMRGLSSHSAFQGLHQSVGERSMLGAFQDVLKDMGGLQPDKLVSYDMFFEGLRHTIKGETQVSISTAENTLTDPFAIRVLKALFLVKYIKFNASLDNLATLLVGGFEENIAELKTKLKDALDLLERQVYIQRVADSYEYLSDKEKDIENEIKSTTITEAEINGALRDLLLSEVLGQIKKVRYEKNRYDYPLELRMDGTRVGSGEESIVVNFITPRKAHDYTTEQLTALSMGNREIIINLGSRKEFDRALELWVKTEKFIPQKHSNALPENEKQILLAKANQNRERKRALASELSVMLEEAQMYFNGSLLQISSKTPVERVKEAVNDAIGTLFPMLGLLGDRVYQESDIRAFLTAAHDLDYGDESMCEAEKELLSMLFRAKASHKNYTVGELLDTLQGRPYGWYPHAIASIIAMLAARGKLELKQNSNSLDKTASLRALTNNREYQSTYVVVTKMIADSALKNAQKLVGELFSIGVSSLGAKELYESAKKESEALISELSGFKSRFDHKFLGSLDKPIERLKAFASLDYDSFFERCHEIGDELLDHAEDTVAPLREFMNGSQHKIYVEIKLWLDRNRENSAYLSADNLAKLQALMQEARPYMGGKVTAAKSAFEEIKAELEAMLSHAREQVIGATKAKIDELSNRADFKALEPNAKNSVLKIFLDMQNRLTEITQLDTLHRLASDEFLTKRYSETLDLIDELTPVPTPPPMPQTAASEGEKPKSVTPPPPPPKKTRVALSEIKPTGFGSLQNAEDVESFIEKLRGKMLSLINEDKEIVI